MARRRHNGDGDVAVLHWRWLAASTMRLGPELWPGTLFRAVHAVVSCCQQKGRGRWAGKGEGKRETKKNGLKRSCRSTGEHSNTITEARGDAVLLCMVRTLSCINIQKQWVLPFIAIYCLLISWKVWKEQNGRVFENQPATNMSRMVSSIMEEGLLWCVDQGWSEAGRPRMACCMTAISSTTSAA